LADTSVLLSSTDIRSSFRFFDKNGDGSISGEELETVMSYFGHEPGTVDIQEMMRQVDNDGNGEIDFKEFVQMMSDAYKGGAFGNQSTDISLATYKKAFQFFDKDGDGFIQAEELRALFSSFGDDTVTDAEIEQMIQEADLDGDGKINFDEFKQILR
ncbi:hypothetical protein Ciccas_008951, partial [Cichlidogyrus casuarinus]